MSCHESLLCILRFLLFGSAHIKFFKCDNVEFPFLLFRIFFLIRAAVFLIISIFPGVFTVGSLLPVVLSGVFAAGFCIFVVVRTAFFRFGEGCRIKDKIQRCLPVRSLRDKGCRCGHFPFIYKESFPRVFPHQRALKEISFSGKEVFPFDAVTDGNLFGCVNGFGIAVPAGGIRAQLRIMDALVFVIRVFVHGNGRLLREIRLIRAAGFVRVIRIIRIIRLIRVFRFIRVSGLVRILRFLRHFSALQVEFFKSNHGMPVEERSVISKGEVDGLFCLLRCKGSSRRDLVPLCIFQGPSVHFVHQHTGHLIFQAGNESPAGDMVDCDGAFRGVSDMHACQLILRPGADRDQAHGLGLVLQICVGGDEIRIRYRTFRLFRVFPGSFRSAFLSG